MHKKYIYIFPFVLLVAVKAAAQLSPGDLAKAHAHLEGLSNCTQCHSLGNKVANDKCVSCHTEIKERLDNRAGFHYSIDVRTKDCASCHNDHHGRNFDMIRFDEKNFDHRATDYQLTGAHAKLDCRQCHIPDYITDRDLKKRVDTFLGLETACNNCHEDYHQKTLDNDCAKCHTTETFSPATKFSHDQTDFALTGQHKTVECIDCHQMETRSGKEFQHFAEVPFSNCNTCHKDPHRKNLGADCNQCHTDQSFTSHSRLNRFNHNQTHFPLKGRHQQINCSSCHTLNASPTLLFQDKSGIPTNNCVACHNDVHEGKLGTTCAECHTEESFLVATNLDQFNHDLTGFELEGKHDVVDCRKCHVSESYTDPLPHQDCADCHVDYHESEFALNGSSPDCAKCHTVDGFTPSQFTLEAHAKSQFPLDGAHLATPCFSCHVQENKWHFRDIGQYCVDCHDDVHIGEITSTYYPDQSCENCHFTESWTMKNSFDHSRTPFVLQGIHLQTNCSACHIRNEEKPFGHFTGFSQTCSACHTNIHGRQFELDGVTDCARCHGFESWDASHFDHNRTRFLLEGKHVNVACDQCHRETIIDSNTYTIYRMERFECADCHQ